MLLKKIANEAGVEAERLIFTGKEHYKDHYKRMELIDLFLDTPVYNGHTTCLEALWMNVPVLTIQGESVSSRLCSSFIHAIGMPDLVSESMESYVQKAVEIGTDSTKLNALKQHVTNARQESSLFDIPKLVSHLETTYLEMWEIHESGESPRDIHIR